MTGNRAGAFQHVIRQASLFDGDLFFQTHEQRRIDGIIQDKLRNRVKRPAQAIELAVSAG
ncbi:MAG: hypothetical protein DI616_19325 [Paracoccus denitrificans]|uniref:Uncharacterized protein n=1 Tax=Paracoccus denitrificans TaxID=266 RepID=A0A533I1Q4_PARDE|nr:MAG: hypothetical protein DI616_19325 [Paracoccus denitrificans]